MVKFSILYHQKLIADEWKHKTDCTVSQDNSIREAFQKKIAQKGTFAHLGGRGVKKS